MISWRPFVALLAVLFIAFIPITAAALTIDQSAGFASHSGLTANGSVTFVGSVARMTDGGFGEAGSIFSTVQPTITSFSTTFTLRDQSVSGAADSVSFVIQNDPRGSAALGGGGGGGGYAGIVNSIAIKFDLFTHGSHNPSTGLFTGGQSPDSDFTRDVPLTGINLGSGDPLQITLTYDGTTLTEIVRDTVTSATFSHDYLVNIPGTVGGPMADVGFTGGTGGETAIQDIQTWRFESAVVPEPSLLILPATGAGLAGVVSWRRHRT